MQPAAFDEPQPKRQAYDPQMLLVQLKYFSQSPPITKGGLFQAR
jgi:hypothetical protein